MTQTSNGLNGNSLPSPPLPLMAKSLRGPRSRKDKAASQNDTVTALPPVTPSEPAPRPPKRAGASRSKASERQAIPADVADLISFAQAYPAQVEGSETPEPPLRADRAVRTVLDAGDFSGPAPKIAFGTVQPSVTLHHNFREAYDKSFREALESYRDNVHPQESDEPVTPIAPAPKKRSRSRLYAGPEAILKEQAPQIVESAESSESAEPEEAATPVADDPSLLGRLGESGRAAFSGVLRRTASFAAAPLRGLRSAWSWYQGRRVLQMSTRRMRVAETISLGEKRFLAVVQVDECQFLVGGGASSVAVLAQLGTPEAARNLMNQRASEAQV